MYTCFSFDSLLYVTTDAVMWSEVNFISSACCQSKAALSWMRFELNASAFQTCITFLMFTFYNILSAVGLCSLSTITACPYCYDYKDLDHIIWSSYVASLFLFFLYCQHLNMMVYILLHAKKMSINLIRFLCAFISWLPSGGRVFTKCDVILKWTENLLASRCHWMLNY